MSQLIGPLPEGTRLIAIADDLLENLGTRTDDGFALTAEWGEPTPEGWYEPIFTATDDGSVVVKEDELDEALAAFRANGVEPWGGGLLTFIKLQRYGENE